jgi:simple sugar transport system permease protein
VGLVTALATVVRGPRSIDRRLVAAAAAAVLGLLDIFVFGHFAHAGDATFGLSTAGAAVSVPSLHVAAAPTAYAMGAATLLLAGLRGAVDLGKRTRHVVLAAVLVFFVISVLCWADAGNLIPLNLVNLFQATLTTSIPIILGAMAGCLCERSGVINIAIEGQLLVGAFTAAMVASAFGEMWLGLASGSVAGGLLGALLAVFAIRFMVDQIILGVVLNVFALGLTDFLFDRVLVPYQNRLNSPPTFNNVKIPGLGDIPIIGPVFFDSTVFLYITYAVVILVQVGLFSTRWGLRLRAVGEHPQAADTVGIRVLGIRYRQVLLGGLVAGIGGAAFTVGSVGSFGEDMTSGLGYIALAALIFGRWRPLGAMGAALIFGFATSLQQTLSTLGTALPSNVLLMAPYVVTIIAVASRGGKIRPPKADGQPYIKA